MIVYKWPHSGLMCKNTDGNSIEASDATLQQSNFNDDMWFIHNAANLLYEMEQQLKSINFGCFYSKGEIENEWLSTRSSPFNLNIAILIGIRANEPNVKWR